MRKAIILSAGQGRRLLPLTQSLPKCLLPVEGSRCSLELQLRELARCGVSQATVVIGFGAEKIEHLLRNHPIHGLRVSTRYNPFVATTNNLVSAWLASPDMQEDFVLLNGDTLFETEVLQRTLDAPSHPVNLAIDNKTVYDDDDMKVTLEGERRLVAVSKAIPPGLTHGESIGLMTFCGTGVTAFQAALDAAVRDPNALRRWYLSVIDGMAESALVRTVSIHGLWWEEVDTAEDLARARQYFARNQAPAGTMAIG